MFSRQDLFSTWWIRAGVFGGSRVPVSRILCSYMLLVVCDNLSTM